MDSLYKPKTKQANNISYQLDNSFRNIPLSYGHQYKIYHQNIKNKPFTQQQGIYLYDLYQQKQDIQSQQNVKDFYKDHYQIDQSNNLPDQSNITVNGQKGNALENEKLKSQQNILDFTSLSYLNNSKNNFGYETLQFTNRSFQNQTPSNRIKSNSSNIQNTSHGFLLNPHENIKNVNTEMMYEIQDQLKKEKIQEIQNKQNNLNQNSNLYYQSFKKRQELQNQQKPNLFLDQNTSFNLSQQNNTLTNNSNHNNTSLRITSNLELNNNNKPNSSNVLNLTQNQYYDTFKSNSSNEKNDNHKNTDNLPHNQKQNSWSGFDIIQELNEDDQDKETNQFLLNDTQNTQQNLSLRNKSQSSNLMNTIGNSSNISKLHIIKHKRNKVPIHLSRETKNQARIFSQIARENVFTNISFTANKDFDYKYDPSDGLVIHLDFLEVNFHATKIKNLKLSYEIINKNTKYILWRQEGENLQYKDINQQKIKIENRQLLQNLAPDPVYHFIIYAEYQLYDLQNRIDSQFYTFSVLPLFKQNGQLNFGKHKLNFLQFCGNRHPILATEGYKFPLAENINCYIRVCRPESYLDFEGITNKGYQSSDNTPLNNNIVKSQLLNNERFQTQSSDNTPLHKNNFKIKKMNSERIIKPSLLNYKQDNTLDYVEREEQDGYWAQRLKKQREQEEVMLKKLFDKKNQLSYKQKKQIEHQYGQFGKKYQNNDFSLYKSSNFHTNLGQNIVNKTQLEGIKTGHYQVKKYF